jgi:hypothetical protein
LKFTIRVITPKVYICAWDLFGAVWEGMEWLDPGVGDHLQKELEKETVQCSILKNGNRFCGWRQAKTVWIPKAKEPFHP